MTKETTQKTRSDRIELDLAKIEAYASRGLKKMEIAAALGISTKTLYRREQDTEEVAEALERGRSKGVAVVADHLMKAIEGGDVRAMIFFLKSVGGWRDTDRVELSGPEGGAIPVAPQPMTKEELDAIRGMMIHERQSSTPEDE